MYLDNYRERIHHYTITMTIMKKLYDDGLLTAAEFNYLEEKICAIAMPLLKSRNLKYYVIQLIR